MIMILADELFGRNLLNMRKKCDFSRASLAKLTGVSVYHLRLIEQGVLREIDSEFVLKLGRIFDVDVEVFCKQEPEKE